LNGVIGDIYNIGSDNQEYSVNQIATMLLKKYKKSENMTKSLVDRPYNDKRYFTNTFKLKELGWENKYNLEDYLDQLSD
jgi:UDP-glucose 4,6-dehydratase